jgi:hypothetical protein
MADETKPLGATSIVDELAGIAMAWEALRKLDDNARARTLTWCAHRHGEIVENDRRNKVIIGVVESGPGGPVLHRRDN